MSDGRLGAARLRIAYDRDLVEIKLGRMDRGTAFATDDADRSIGVGGGDGGTRQTHAFVAFAVDGIATIAPLTGRTDLVVRGIVGLSSGVWEQEILSAHQPGSDLKQIVAKLLCRHPSLDVGVAQMQYIELAFAQEDHRVHLLEEAFQDEAVAGIADMVTLKTGKGKRIHRLQRRRRLCHKPTRGEH